eukprot:CAMPEP_0116888808 /NCGR_PEP_ID=MMETSP0463-20121206/24007_1 /TAXON_ID=181622 /ORGANISM="Strombidinopsis sp, Strain SopsisLIS2011" /LENGTH=100 /DNA_ID=CAMNT_0004554297 /DNA_START=480 /DNA_END=782 /DNA_ORIENTATION=-
MRTKTDFTYMGGLIWICSTALLMMCLFGAIFTFSKTWYLILAGLSVVLFGIFLIYDVQLVMGKGSYALGYDDYIIGALVIYMDVIGIFLELLKILAATKD